MFVDKFWRNFLFLICSISKASLIFNIEEALSIRYNLHPFLSRLRPFLSNVEYFKVNFIFLRPRKPLFWYKINPYSKVLKKSINLPFFIHFFKTLRENFGKLLFLVLGTIWGSYGQTFSLIARSWRLRPNLAKMRWTKGSKSGS